MIEQTSWKGHTFTLLVFAGIVALCSIFFTLGMLVGRTQAQRIASVEAATTAIERPMPSADSPVAAEDPPELTFYESVGTSEPAPLELPHAPDSERERAGLSREAGPDDRLGEAPDEGSRAMPGNVINLQLGAFRNASDAGRFLNEVRIQGFPVLVLAPAPNDPNPLYRVQVGPYRDVNEAQAVRLKLESAGYQVLVRR